MRIDCYLSLRCNAEEALRKNFFKALSMEGIHAEVNFYRIDDTQTRSLGLKGLPSVLIYGEDIQPAEGTVFY